MEYKISECKLMEMIDLFEIGWVEYDIATGHNWICVCLIDRNDPENAKDFYFEVV